MLAQLHHAELISVGQRLDSDALFSRKAEAESTDRKERFSNPLYLRFPLFNPDLFLTRFAPLFRCFFSKKIFFSWLFLVLMSLVVLAPDMRTLLQELDRFSFTAPATLITALLVWPVLKLLHEFAHAVAIKHYGGDVREMGLAVLVLYPIPYVDASASAVFPNKWHRIVVSSAGIIVDLTLAVVALSLWSISSGFVSHLALVVLLLTGASTLAFNGNPLLKFDAYYVLSDLIEIPNLAERSQRYMKGLFANALFGVSNSVFPVDRREALWLAFYGIVSSAYRFGLTLFIAWILSARLFIFGFLLALYAIIISIVWPSLRNINSVWKNSKISRLKIITFAGIVPSVILLFIGVVPVAGVVSVQGVVWLPDDAIIRVDSECEINNAPVANGAWVKAGDVLIECENPLIDEAARILLAERDEIKAKQGGLLSENQAQYQVLEAELKANNSRLMDSMKRREGLTVVAAADGQFVVEGDFELQGQVLSAGTLAAYVIPSTNERTVRLALSEETANPRLQWQTVSIRSPSLDGLKKSHSTHVTHLSAAATLSVPSAALTSVGGGDLLASIVDQRVQLDSPAYNVELAWPATAAPMPVGSRVPVRLTGDSEPLMARWMRHWQRAFLGRVRA